ncbi:DsbA family protein, partial [bacterium]|nr:DsbA family protein [bacterium]
KLAEKVDTKKNDPAPAPNPRPSIKSNIEVSDTDHVRGRKDAPITIVEYSDIQCPFSSRFHSTMNQIMDAYPNDVRWVYRHFPLSRIHPLASRAAEASECAEEQGMFWEYIDVLYENQSSLSRDYLLTAATTAGLNSNKLEICLDSGKYVKKVGNEIQEGRSNGVSGTPGSFINGVSLKGAVPFDQLKISIEALR